MQHCTCWSHARPELHTTLTSHVLMQIYLSTTNVDWYLSTRTWHVFLYFVFILYSSLNKYKQTERTSTWHGLQWSKVQWNVTVIIIVITTIVIVTNAVAVAVAAAAAVSLSFALLLFSSDLLLTSVIESVRSSKRFESQSPHTAYHRFVHNCGSDSICSTLLVPMAAVVAAVVLPVVLQLLRLRRRGGLAKRDIRPMVYQEYSRSLHLPASSGRRHQRRIVLAGAAVDRSELREPLEEIEQVGVPYRRAVLVHVAEGWVDIVGYSCSAAA